MKIYKHETPSLGPNVLELFRVPLIKISTLKIRPKNNTFSTYRKEKLKMKKKKKVESFVPQKYFFLQA